MSSSSTLVLPQPHSYTRETEVMERDLRSRESDDGHMGPMWHELIIQMTWDTRPWCIKIMLLVSNRCLHKHKKNNVSQHKCNLCPRYQPSVMKDNKCLSLFFINLIYFISLNFWLKNWYWISPSPWFLGDPPIYNRSTKARFLVLVFQVQLHQERHRHQNS